MLRCIRTHLKPEKIASASNLNPPHNDIPVVDRFRTAGKTAMAEAVVTILDYDSLICPILRCSVSPRSLASL